MTFKIYGISNCDTVRKARKWLAVNNIEIEFHDFRKDGLTQGQVNNWLKYLSWQQLLNKRSTSYRGLAEEIKNNLNEKTAVKLMLENPTLIKRPLLELTDKVLVGFDENTYESLI